jgi:2,4-dienoyl-CoA reductase-like NADH-dependent reductase (Old Yellow Enzyme family)
VPPYNQPSPLHLSAYERWGKAGYGLIITGRDADLLISLFVSKYRAELTLELGNVQVDARFLGDAGDVVSPAPDTVVAGGIWTEWAARAQVYGTPTLVQLCHAGRQSAVGDGARGFFEKTMAPSPVPLNFGPGLIATLVRKFMFGTPREMSVTDINCVVHMFVDGAKAAERAGFKGVELHGAHGYLISTVMIHIPPS